MAISSTVFSEYEAKQIGVSIEGDSVIVPCVGSIEEELEVKTMTKNCRGVVAKTRTRGTGNGTLSISVHCPIELYRKLFGMSDDGLKKGVYAYGYNSRHPEFTLTVDVFDEDGNEKLKAYPRCVIQSNMSRTIENGADEVAEIEIEVAVMPDDNDNGMYECLVSDLEGDEGNIKSQWMENFNLDLIKAEA